ERPPSALDLDRACLFDRFDRFDRARRKTDERRRRRNRRARGISIYVVLGRLPYAVGEKILVLRDILVLDVIGFHGKADELRRRVCAIFDGRTAREHLSEADLGRLVDVDPGWRGRLGLSGTSWHWPSCVKVTRRRRRSVVAKVRRR